MKRILLSLILAWSFNSQAEIPQNGFTEAQMAEMASANQTTATWESEWRSLFKDPYNPLTLSLIDETTAVPVGEYEQAGYLLFSSNYPFSSFAAKQAMAKYLPEDVTLVVFTYSRDKSHLKQVREDFEDLVPEERLKVIYLPNANRGFWARDGVPVPIWRTDKQADELFTVVDARYYHQFEADEEVAAHFSSELTAHDYYYEGGNFMANAKGDCLVVNTNAVQKIPDSIFSDHYGCKELYRLPFVKGIGHADESVKFVSDTEVLTDVPKYAEILEEAGFEVTMLPRPQTEMENYTNSLIVNGTVFVPVFGQNNDQEAMDIYEGLGLKVVPINTSVLSNQGLGSIHCITMTYPPVSFTELLEAVDGEAVE